MVPDNALPESNLRPSLDPWAYVPLVPTTIPGTGIPESFLRELVLKTVWAHDVPSLGQISQVTGLHSRVVEELVIGLNREGLFEPFVSGKPTGMGLGLAVSRTIAQAHGGSLEAAAVAHGEFHLVLPCVQSD